MEFIAHRINTIEELKKVPKEYGVELDLRDFGERLILQHDPFIDGEDFEEYLKFYNHGTMILNIKSERIEHKVLELIKKYNIQKYFFLDSSFPMINLLTNQGERKIALRFSEFETLDNILMLKDKIDWVWIDCFSKLPINISNYKLLRKLNLKLCLVSPELQLQEEKINEYRYYLITERVHLDAICCKVKNIPKWKNKNSLLI